MPLTGLDIYKLLPKTNCKKCGFPTCLAFAMAIAAKKASLELCPDVSEDAKKTLAESAEPPIRTIVLQDGPRAFKLGGETVLFRHEKTFWNPCGLGVYLTDEMSDAEIGATIENFKKLQFERVGQKVRSEFLYLRNLSDDPARFQNLLKAAAGTDAFIIINSAKPEVIEQSVKSFPDRKFILSGADKSNYENYLKIASDSKCPMTITSDTLEELTEVTTSLAKQNFREIILELKPSAVLSSLNTLTQIRRLALKKNLRSLGYPVIVFTSGRSVLDEVAEAAQYIEKYASIVILKNADIAAHLALVSLRQNIYTDPQKPVAVEPKLYSFGSVSENSPVLVTTNFSLTYYSVAPEIENSKVASYLLIVDTEGMSVLTAWAADKFSAEKIAEAMKKENLQNLVKHNKIIIPGYVAVLSGKLADISGWTVLVGPKEASGIPKFLKTLS